MDKITISDLEVRYHVGVPPAERSMPQKLHLTVEMLHDFTSAAARDNLAETIDYAAVCERLLNFGNGRHWELIETLACEIAALLINEFRVKTVFVEVKKFIIPQARYVSVSVTRMAG